MFADGGITCCASGGTAPASGPAHCQRRSDFRFDTNDVIFAVGDIHSAPSTDKQTADVYFVNGTAT